MPSASARNSALPAMVVAEKYLELCCIWRAKEGKLEEVKEEEVIGMKASRGPREGVVAVRDPDGLAVRNVPLQPQFSDFSTTNATGKWTYVLVRKLTTSSLPDNLDITQTWFTSVGSIVKRISDSLRSLAPSGA